MRQFLIILFSMLMIVSCDDDTSTNNTDDGNGNNKNPGPDNIFYTKKVEATDTYYELMYYNIMKVNAETKVEETVIDSALISSPPVNGKIVYTSHSYYLEDYYYRHNDKIIFSNIDGSGQVVIDEDAADYMVGEAILSPKADKIIYFVNNRPQIADIDGTNKMEIFGGQVKPYTVAFNHAGSKLCFFTNDEVFYIYDIASKTFPVTRNDIDLIYDFELPVIWSEDDSKLFILCGKYNQSELLMINADGTDNKIFNNVDAFLMYDVSAKTDQIAYTHLDNETERINIRMMDLQGENDELFMAGEAGRDYAVMGFSGDGKNLYAVILPDGLKASDDMQIISINLETKEEEVLISNRPYHDKIYIEK